LRTSASVLSVITFGIVIGWGTGVQTGTGRLDIGYSPAKLPFASPCCFKSATIFVELELYNHLPFVKALGYPVPQSQLLTYIRLLVQPENSVPRAPMDFRVLPPQWRPDIGSCHADPNTRFGKQRSDRFAISYHLVAIAR
jgi:hypothetical protein